MRGPRLRCRGTSLFYAGKYLNIRHEFQFCAQKEVALSQKENKGKEVDAMSSFSLILFYFFSNSFSGYTYLYDDFHHLKKRDTQCLF